MKTLTGAKEEFKIMEEEIEEFENIQDEDSIKINDNMWIEIMKIKKHARIVFIGTEPRVFFRRYEITKGKHEIIRRGG